MNHIDFKTDEKENINNPEEQMIKSVNQFFYRLNMQAKRIHKKILRKELKKKQTEILGKMRTLEEERTMEEEIKDVIVKNTNETENPTAECNVRITVRPSEKQTEKVELNSESNAEFYLQLNMEAK